MRFFCGCALNPGGAEIFGFSLMGRVSTGGCCLAAGCWKLLEFKNWASGEFACPICNPLLLFWESSERNSITQVSRNTSIGSLTIRRRESDLSLDLLKGIYAVNRHRHRSVGIVGAGLHEKRSHGVLLLIVLILSFVQHGENIDSLWSHLRNGKTRICKRANKDFESSREWWPKSISCAHQWLRGLTL